MTIEELIKKYACNCNELINIYAEYASCENCPLKKQCPVKGDGVQKCADYLTSVLEVEK